MLLVDHGETVEHGEQPDKLYRAYLEVRDKGRHLLVKPGDTIPIKGLEVRVVTVADSFDAMMTDRPYRSRLPLDLALGEMRRHTSKQFAPEVVSAFCRLLLKEIQGLTRERVIIPIIGLKFDREAAENQLTSMLAELEGVRPKYRSAAS